MRRGFSLIELLVVVAIIALLVGAAAPYYADYVKESKTSKAKSDLDIIKQAVLLYNSREDAPYQGTIATSGSYLPLFGESDFLGLQGRYLTNIPIDPWGKNYKLDPFGGFVFSDGPDSNKTTDDLREYYIKELALNRVEWQDMNSNRTVDNPDLFYFTFNKSVWVEGGMLSTDFDVYENNVKQVAASATLDFSFAIGAPLNPGYTDENHATATVLVATVNNNAAQVKVGVHSLALSDDPTKLSKYREVVTNRRDSNNVQTLTSVEKTAAAVPLRVIVRTSPIKIIQKQ